MSTVARLLASGSGPARVRAQLKGQTRALTQTAARLSAEQVQSARLVDTPLPETVLGGDLLGLLSGPLQALLRGEAPDPTISEPVPGTRPRLDAPTSQRKRKPTYQAGGVADRKFRRAGANGSNDQKKPGRGVDGGRTPVIQSEPVSRAPGLAGLSSTPVQSASAGGAPVDAKRVFRAERGDGAPGVKRPMAATLLAREVEEYFQPAPASASQPAPMTAEPRPALPKDAGAARAVAHLGSGPAAAASAGALLARGWPVLSGRLVAERLQAFVAGGLPPEPGGAAGSSGEGQRVEVNNTFHIQVGSAADRDGSPLGELSNQVAEILRQQAIHHGIDVT
jgi:hypothetical protein